MEKEPRAIEKQEVPKSLYEQLEAYNTLPDTEKEKRLGELLEIKKQLNELIDVLEDPASILSSEVTSVIPSENDLDNNPDFAFEISLGHIKEAMEKIIEVYPKIFKK
jgi:hypothetical protein